MSAPSVSVVVPLHNSSTTVERALRSVLDQTHPPLEIIAVDDASTDSTSAIVEQLAITSKIPVLLERLTENKGPGFTRNTGWDVAQGDLVAFLDADDAWHPQKLELQVRAMVNNPDVAMSCHRHRFSIEDDWDTRLTSDHRFFGLHSFLIKNRCATPSVIVRRNIPERFGDGSHSEDYLLWMRIVAAHGPCLRIESPLVHCFNPAFGGSGLSGQLLTMERAELTGFRTLHRERKISAPTFVSASLWSLGKFVTRMARVTLSLPGRQR